jgi:hypothetical protein
VTQSPLWFKNMSLTVIPLVNKINLDLERPSIIRISFNPRK